MSKPPAPGERRWVPTKVQIAAAQDKTVPDLIAPGLRVLFCGINPGLYTAAVGHHFGRPGNRFWPALHAAGFTPRLLSPFEERELLAWGCGITNLVARATAAADELTDAEIIAGGHRLVATIEQHRPEAVAVVGVGAYRVAFGRKKAKVGRQEDHRIAGAEVWVLPNPSGLNAHYNLPEMAKAFRELREAVGGGSPNDEIRTTSK